LGIGEMKRLTIAMLLSALLGDACVAAEYLGSDIDGRSYSCTAFSYDTGNYYYLTCEFSGDEVIITFPSGGSVNVTMDSEEIDDPNSISAFDYDKGAYWDLDVDL
jgi:hypothetical protein